LSLKIKEVQKPEDEEKPKKMSREERFKKFSRKDRKVGDLILNLMMFS